MAPSSEAAVDPARARSEALWAAVGVVVVLGLIKHAGQVVPFVYRHGFTLALGFQLYLPLYLLGRNGVTRASLGLDLPSDAFGRSLWWLAVVSVLTVVPYAIGLHFYMTVGFDRTFTPAWPSGLLENLAINLFLVGLGEELFFRGYLQERLTHVWPDRGRLLGAPVGPAIVVAAAVFALAHFIGEYNPARLGPFFPGLVFGWLRAKTGNLIAPIGYHAFCNVLADALIVSYR